MPFHSDGPKKLAMLLLLVIALPLLDGVALNSASGEEGLPTIFNGKSLDGWEGDQKHWRVENGVLIGETTTPLEKTTYLILRQGTVDAQGTHDDLLESSESYRRIFAQYDKPRAQQHPKG